MGREIRFEFQYTEFPNYRNYRMTWYGMCRAEPQNTQSLFSQRVAFAQKVRHTKPWDKIQDPYIFGLEAL